MGTTRRYRLRKRKPAFTPAMRRQLETGHDFFGDAYGTNVEAMRAAWFEHRREILRDWQRDHPGTRPWAWWRFDAPEPRRRLGGIGTPITDEWTHFGMPAEYAGDYSMKDPPRYEPESDYLRRVFGVNETPMQSRNLRATRRTSNANY